MASIGYHASHEQFTPRELLEYALAAEKAGFQAGMCSDHIAPWSERQGQSGFAWSWLGAALQATRLSFGVVTVPGNWRYHPTILAQAAATLSQMFPGRFWMAPGSGEWLNEHVTGGRWPSKAERNERLLEGVRIMRSLWAGETVSSDGPIPVDEARLWTLPVEPIRLMGAALTRPTARWLGSWADGMITVNAPPEKLRELISEFRDGGGEGKPVYLQTHLSYARTEEEARANAWDQWRGNLYPSLVLSDVKLVEQFDALAAGVDRNRLDDAIIISSDPDRHADSIAEQLELGFAGIYLHNVGRNQQEFIETFGEHVLARLKTSTAGGGTG